MRMYRIIGVNIFLVCIVAVLVSGKVPKKYEGWGPDMVVNAVTIDKVPYTVQLRNGAGNIVCAGCLITPQHVLTAAHCFDQYEPADITVVAGASAQTDSGVQRGIEKVFKHDTYNPTTFHNDAAVLKLQSPMELSRNVQTVDVCSRQFGPETYLAEMRGWLASDQDKVQTMRSEMYSKEKCAKVWEEESITEKFTDSMVCDGNAERFSCTHVSGGPGIVAGEVCLIVVGGPSCENSNFPGALTDVYEIREFVERSIKA